MKRFLFLFLIALVTIVVLLFLFNPSVLEKIWLWIVGLIGPIIAFTKKGADKVKDLFDRNAKPEPQKVEAANANNNETFDGKQENEKLRSQINDLENQLKEQSEPDDFEGHTLNLLRYKDDGDTTLGLLFLDQNFFCYTLEDTFREVKVAGKTRIPAGSYRVDFNKNITALTQKYRNNYPWFEYHLHLKNVPQFEGVYIHVGNYHQDTEGCILIADGIGSQNNQVMVTQSRQAYQRLYLKLKLILDQNIPLRIKVRNESWFTQYIEQKNSQLIQTP